MTTDLVQLKERLKDKWWRLNNLYYIIDKQGKKVRFQPNWAQEKFFHDAHYRNLILKSRQLGFTTFIDIDYLDDCLFNSNISAGIIAHTREDADSIFERKIKFPFENLPTGLKEARKPKTDRVGEYKFPNGSSIRVSTSFRSGTLQRLHISEFGKICAKTPDKAKEIVTGAIEAVPLDGRIDIESTAEGQEGYFYEYCQEGQSLARMNKELVPMDYKFHFFPWYEHPDYHIENYKNVVITADTDKYFRELKQSTGYNFQKSQIAWYQKKVNSLKEDMKREYPSIPDEAFEQSIEGAYFAKLLSHAEAENRIGHFPYDPQYPVYTAWDLGFDDAMSIWCYQHYGRGYKIIYYYENSGEGFPYYVDHLRSKGFSFDRHKLPHDIANHELGTGKSRLETLQKLGFYNIDTVKRPTTKLDGINAIRNIIPHCVFHEQGCFEGIKKLKHYRKEWDDKHGVWKKNPRHDENSHAADSFQTFALGSESLQDRRPKNLKRTKNRWR